VVFVVTGSQETGSGHAYRALELANLLTKHELHFLTTQGSHVAQKIIGKTNYNLHQQSAKTLLEEINSMQPDVVINDILDTEADYVHSLRQKNYTVINFEDLGAGAKKANAVINALYPPDFSSQNIYSGPEYFIARDEFIYHQEKIVNANVKEVLITFGGTDPSNLTQKTVEALLPLAKELNFRLKIILGIGYSEKKWLQKHPELPVLQNVNNISDHFYAADLIFTSAGRTVYEIACIGTPTIVMAQNAREMTHLFANENNGFIHLGLGKNTTVKALQEAFKMVYSDEKKRTNMNQRMLSKKLKESKANLLELLNKTIG
jgi:spore coat polysaccharide biosynthesis predicted glycosyltransferase SpsG